MLIKQDSGAGKEKVKKIFRPLRPIKYHYFEKFHNPAKEKLNLAKEFAQLKVENTKKWYLLNKDMLVGDEQRSKRAWDEIQRLKKERRGLKKEENRENKDSSSQESKGEGKTPMGGVIRMEKPKKDVMSIVFCLLALLLLSIDKIGTQYVGYNFDFNDIIASNWVAVASSSFFLIFIIWRFFTKVKHKDPSFLLWILIVTVLNIIFKRFTTGTFDLSPLLNWGIIAFLILLLFGLGAIRRKIAENWYDDVMYLVMALTISFFWIHDQWFEDTKAVFHFFFIIAFGFFYIKKHEENPNGAYLYTSVLLFVDFYGHSLIPDVPILQYFPFLTLFVIGYIYTKGESGFGGVIFFIFLFTTFIIPNMIQPSELRGELAFERETGGRSLKEFWTELREGITANLESRLDFASGGYYSRVEDNKREPLGVYLENIESADPEYYSDERITVWGTVKARTLDDPVNLKVSCYVEKPIEGSSKKDRIYGKIIPEILEKGKEIFTFEEDDFQCRFEKGMLEAGNPRVIIAATFNFDTQAYLKTYFIEEERKRAMVREGIDVFDEFGIKDKDPISVFTNGPIALALATKTPPTGISISDPGIEVSWIGVSFDHNTDWQGDIEEIEELVILVPEGFTLDPEFSCNREFTKYTIDQCKKSCSEKFKGASSFNNKVKVCEENCDFLFGTGNFGESFNGYALDVQKIVDVIEEHEEDIKNNKRFRSFRCALLVNNPSQILGNTPISTKYFRSRARYNYTVEDSVSIKINKLPGEIESIKSEILIDKPLVKNKIIKLAREARVEPSLVLAIAHWETRGQFNHCKDFSYDCATQSETVCSFLKKEVSSCGLMQINTNVHPKGGYNCDPGKTIYDLDCNIKTGIDILQQAYDDYGTNNEKYRNTVEKRCVNNEFQKNKYLNFKGWDRAIRAYNGLGCTPPGADLDYVKNVKSLRDSYFLSINAII